MIRPFGLMLGVVFAWAGAAGAEVTKVEVGMERVTEWRDQSGSVVGLRIQADVPGAGSGKAIMGAFLWLEVSAERVYNQATVEGPLCLAAAAVVGAGSLGRREPGVPIPEGVRRTICFDVTDIIGDQMKAQLPVSDIAIVPCEGEDLMGGVASTRGEPVAGWIEFLFLDGSRGTAPSGR